MSRNPMHHTCHALQRPSRGALAMARYSEYGDLYHSVHLVTGRTHL